MTHLLTISNPSRVHLRKLLQTFAETLQADSSVLDLGAGSTPYADLFNDHNYVASDFRQNASETISLVGDMANINAESASFDAVVCSQALHAHTSPSSVLGEISRVLKPGGRAFISVVFAYEPVDEPYDCFRITPHGMKALLEPLPLSLERYEFLEGYLGTLSYQCHYAWRTLPKTYLPISGLFFLLAWVLARLELRTSKSKTMGYPKNYVFYICKQ